MRLALVQVALCFACAIPGGAPPATPAAPAVVSVTTDSLTANDRARIVEKIALFRKTIFLNDTTRLDGCSVAEVIGVGPSYRDLIDRSNRSLISDASTGCVPLRGLVKQGIRVVIGKIINDGSEVSVEAHFTGGRIAWSETYKLRTPTRRGGNWIVKEVRVHSMATFD